MLLSIACRLLAKTLAQTIQDALGFGTPVITTRRTPWQDIEKQAVGWFAEPNVDSVEQALRQALALDDTSRNQ